MDVTATLKGRHEMVEDQGMGYVPFRDKALRW